MANNTYIGPPKRPHIAEVGDKVTVILDGTVTQVEPGLGIVTITGSTRGAENLTWSFDIPIATELYIDDGLR